MGSKYHKCYNENTIIKIKLKEKTLEFVTQTDNILKFLKQIKPEIHEKYVTAFTKRLNDIVEEYQISKESINIKALVSETSYLKDNEKLAELVIRFVFKHLSLPERYKIDKEEIELRSIDRVLALERLSYYRVKAFEDVLGKEEGIKLYTEVVILVVKEMKQKMKSNPKTTIKSANKGAIEYWCEEGIADFTFEILDDGQCIYRFDTCVTHEALKDLNDPDIAYYASCYIGDIEEWNKGKTICMRRTQTLHHADFCDELYWDSRVHKEPPKQPSLEFTKNIAQEVKEK
ncbi:MAG: L-2-amino-thiazoline-4-carboxylic acid hydrolase [Candidatus Heimdallarchaeota archaeon]